MSIFHSFTVLCPVFVDCSQGCKNTSAQILRRLLRRSIFIHVLYITSFCAKKQRVWDRIRCAVSNFHPFVLLCTVFVDWSQRCPNTRAQTLPRLLRSIIFMQLLYIATVCARRQRVWARICSPLEVRTPFTLLSFFALFSSVGASSRCPNLTQTLYGALFLFLINYYVVSVCTRKARSLSSCSLCCAGTFHFASKVVKWTAYWINIEMCRCSLHNEYALKLFAFSRKL